MRDAILIDALDRAEGAARERVLQAAAIIRACETLGMRPAGWHGCELEAAARAWIAAIDAVEAACAGESEDA